MVARKVFQKHPDQLSEDEEAMFADCVALEIIELEEQAAAYQRH